ncbi:nucleolar protein 12 isoform 1-T1 [Ctenodactylus gundi]
MGRNRKKKRDGDDRRPRLVLSFDEEKRREYLTGFHKRKVERKKAAVEEIKQRLKEERRKLREERHQEYLKMLAEREEALEEADELDRLVTAKTESVHYDHPNHTVTVTTISDLDLSGARLLGLTLPQVGPSPVPGDEGAQGQAGLLGDCSEQASSVEKPTRALPRKSKDPLLSQRISSLTASLHAHSRKKVKRKRPRRVLGSTKKPPSATRTSKTQRRRLTGKAQLSGE